MVSRFGKDGSAAGVAGAVAAGAGGGAAAAPVEAYRTLAIGDAMAMGDIRVHGRDWRCEKGDRCTALPICDEVEDES